MHKKPTTYGEVLESTVLPALDLVQKHLAATFALAKCGEPVKSFTEGTGRLVKLLDCVTDTLPIMVSEMHAERKANLQKLASGLAGMAARTAKLSAEVAQLTKVRDDERLRTRYHAPLDRPVIQYGPVSESIERLLEDAGPTVLAKVRQSMGHW